MPLGAFHRRRRERDVSIVEQSIALARIAPVESHADPGAAQATHDPAPEIALEVEGDVEIFFAEFAPQLQTGPQGGRPVAGVDCSSLVFSASEHEQVVEVRVVFQQRRPGALDRPGDVRLRTCLPQRGKRRQRVHNIAQRAEADHQDAR